VTSSLRSLRRLESKLRSERRWEAEEDWGFGLREVEQVLIELGIEHGGRGVISVLEQHRGADAALYRWLLRLVGDEALAEDLLSEVLLDVWRQAASFEGALVSLDVAAGDWALQGALSAAPSD